MPKLTVGLFSMDDLKHERLEHLRAALKAAEKAQVARVDDLTGQVGERPTIERSAAIGRCEALSAASQWIDQKPGALERLSKSD